MSLKKALLTAFSLLMMGVALSQNLSKKVDSWVSQQLPMALAEHRELVRLPNIPISIDDMALNAKWLKSAFSTRGFNVEVLETGSVPVVFATKVQDPELPTVLFYIHYDGQAVDPSRWDQEDPFEPVIRSKDASGGWKDESYENLESWNVEWRIYGRSAADDKGPIIMLLHAMDILREKKIKPAYNISVLLDGEEESGSRGLTSTLEKYKGKYKADRMLILDGPIHPTNSPTLTFGCRGSSSATLIVYGPETAQHSGHYGNYAPNPVFRMMSLFSTMKDDEGRTIIPGFYDGIQLDERTRKVLSEVPDDEHAIQSGIGIAEADKVGNSYQESLQYPSLNVKGMASGWIGSQTRTIIPEKATAQLGMRLVVETDGERMLELLRKHIENQGYYVIDREPTHDERRRYSHIATFIPTGYTNAFRTEMESPTGVWLTGAIKNIYGREPVRIRTMGGTVPITPIIQILGVPAVIVPLVNMDNNQHSPNENLRVGNLANGIKTLIGVVTEGF